MNLTRDKAIEAMDLLIKNGYTVALQAIPEKDKFRVPGHEGPLYRIAVTQLTFDQLDLRTLCDLAESIGLMCRLTLNEIRFEPINRRSEVI